MDVVKCKQDCCGCHACYNACPAQAIEMYPDEEGFLYPVILKEKCIQCDKCKAACPILHKPTRLPLQVAYGCYASKEDEQKSSSSGGIFSVLARMVLSVNGIVCGAAYDEKQAVYHLVIDSEKDLYRLKETKYVQSRIGDVFKNIENALKRNKTVLFSGTSCQVAGLKGYLRKEYENLLCIDLICHGVPSPEVWQRYMKEIAGGRQIERVIFRNKSRSISNITLDYYLDDGNVVKENYGDSLYMKGFLQNLYVRPACFECKFKGTKRCSDLTIGDFWAAQEYHPNFYDKNGVSAVIVHSEKGQKWFEKAKVDLYIVQATIEEVACWNENLFVSATKNPKRTEFFAQWNNKELMELIDLLTQNCVKEEHPTMITRLRKWLR